MPLRHSFSSEDAFSKALRDWFAGQALAGLLAQTDKADSAAEFARQAYVCADAMLEARK